MVQVFTRLIPLLLLLVLARPGFAAQGLAIDPATCLGCHGNKISAEGMASSVHGKNGCTSCHIEIIELAKHMRGEIKVGKVQCVRCHKKEAAEHAKSVHSEKGIGCAQCHTDMHSHTYWNKDKRRVIVKCTQCHKDERGFSQSVHGKGVLAGNQDSAACNDCHNLHEIKALGDPNSHSNREFHTKVCLRCHADEKLHGELPRQELPPGLPGEGCRLRRLPHRTRHPAVEGPHVLRQPGQPGTDLQQVPRKG